MQKIVSHLQLVIGLFCLGTLNGTLATTNVAVFCSADDKVSDGFKEDARWLGSELAKNQFGLVTGGSKTGLMKEVVNGYVGVASSLTNLHGVLPQALASFDVQHPAIPTENLQWVDTIHIRLTAFHERADVIIALPGGFGTLHEILDFLVHKQFGLIQKKIILLNCDGFWNNLINQFQTMIEQNLLTEKALAGLEVFNSVQDCMNALVVEKGTVSEQGLQDRYWER